MKNIIQLSLICFLTSLSFALFSQSNNAFKYQAVARDSDGDIIQNGEVALRISILENGIAEVYAETHNSVPTNKSGVFSLNVGFGDFDGGSANELDEIDWGLSDHSIRIELDTDVTDGIDYQPMGTAPLLRVPYAMHATSVEFNDDADADPSNEIQNLTFDPNANELRISDGNVVNLSSLVGGGGTDNQNISLDGTTLMIEDGNSVNLGVIQDGFTDADADPANEIQFISYNEFTNELEISEGNKITLPMGGGSDADADPTNEIQDLFLDPETNSIHITGSPNGVYLGPPDADFDPSNEIQELNYDGTVLSLSNGGGAVTIPLGGGDDADADPTNEIQNLTFDNETNELTLTNGGGSVTIPTGGTDADADPTNEIQNLTFDPETNTLYLSDNDEGIFLGAFDADTDPSNELQYLEYDEMTNRLYISGDKAGISLGSIDNDKDQTNELQSITYDPTTYMVTLSDGGQIDLSNLKDVDGGMTGTDDQTISISGTTLSIEDGNMVDLAVIQDGTIDDDADATNEIQTLSQTGETIELSNGGGTVIVDTDATNEIQTLSQTTETIELSNGGGFVFVDTDATNEIQTLSTTNHMLSLSDGGGSVLVDTNPENELQGFFLTEDNILEVSAPESDVIQQIDFSHLSSSGGSTFWSTADEGGIFYPNDVFVGDEYNNAMHLTPDALHFHSSNGDSDAIITKDNITMYNGLLDGVFSPNNLQFNSTFFGNPLTANYSNSQLTFNMNGTNSMEITPVNILMTDVVGTPGTTVNISSQAYGLIELRPKGDIATIQLISNYNGSDKGRIITDELEIRGGSDLAEYFDVSKVGNNKPLAGMVVSIDPNNEGKLMIADQSYDSKVAGIISGANGVNVGMHMGQKGTIADGQYPIALTGRVYVYADASKGPINIGDILTSSSTPGYAMKATDKEKRSGASIGKAMTSLESGKGYVLVLVNLQ